LNIIASNFTNLGTLKELGGAIQAHDSNLRVSDQTIFEGNIGLKGGAIYPTCRTRECQFIYTNVIFTNNQAEQGGAYYYSSVRP
jgi:hypothetical protein